MALGRETGHRQTHFRRTLCAAQGLISQTGRVITMILFFYKSGNITGYIITSSLVVVYRR
jgi:hypothetical protein